MSLRIDKKLAWEWTRQRYRRGPVIEDVPRSRELYFSWFGNAKKIVNYVRVRRAYHVGSLTVDGHPSALRVDPTSICNLRCPLCPTGAGEAGRHAGRMSVATYERVLDQFGDYVFCVHLWGWGEPLLHKNLWDLVSMTHERSIGTEISSHLSVPLSDTDIEAMIRSGLSWLIASIDGTSNATYAHYRLGGRFDLAVDNLRRIARAKRELGSLTPFVEWQIVPNCHNEAEIADIAAVAGSHGADGVRIKPIRVDKIANLTFEGDVGDALRAWRPKDPRYFHAVGDSSDAFLDMTCPFLWRSVTIHHDGAVAPCCETYRPEHDLAKLADFPQAWNGNAYREARRVALGQDLTEKDTATPCFGCKVFSKPMAKTLRVERGTPADGASG